MTTTIDAAIANILNAQGIRVAPVDAIYLSGFMRDYLQAELFARAASSGLYSESEKAEHERSVQTFCDEHGIDRAEIFQR